MSHSRHGAKQPERFNPARAALLDDPARFLYLPIDRVIALLDPPTGAIALDFGTGTGAYAIPLAQARPDVTVIALDEQPEMLTMLRAKPEVAALPNLKALLPDAVARLTGAVDCVLAINVLHELGDDALRGLVELLKPLGRALFIDWNAEVDRPVGPPRDHVYSASDAVRRLAQFGLVCDGGVPLRYHYVIEARRA
ncbi:MAG TPA: class I SAM-dependent methyltransferase [Candidatus Binataceae bacterium]|nr:class I SAM-dependent methyltransferase [Candidatus Binataceae bacterium]